MAQGTKFEFADVEETTPLCYTGICGVFASCSTTPLFCAGICDIFASCSAGATDHTWGAHRIGIEGMQKARGGGGMPSPRKFCNPSPHFLLFYATLGQIF